jgi:thiol:disulfide interchange protein
MLNRVIRAFQGLGAVQVVGVLAALLLATAAARAQDEVVVTAKSSKAAVIPGEQFAIAVIFDHKEGWHIHPHQPVVPREFGDFQPIATEVVVDAPKSLEQWAIIWPKPHEVQVAFAGTPVMYGVYEGRSIVHLPLRLSPDAAPGQTLRINLKARYQACDDRSCMAEEEIPLTVELPVITLAQQAQVPAAAPGPDFDDFDSSVFGTPPTGGKAAAAGANPVRFNAFGLSFEVDPRGAGLLLMLLLAALGGFILNFTPCVLPVLPLKIMGISASAGHPARCLYLGSIVSLGVVAFWMFIGGAIAFISGFSAISSLFQTPWFSMGVGLFILLMAVGMLGAYAVRLPRAVYLINPNHETAFGSFLFGVMTAVLATPCIAPFMGSAAAWAATQKPPTTLAMFGAIGAGMALPYLALSAFPKLVSRVPRTGPASELIKQVMGLLLVAIAIFFLGTGLDPLLRNPVDPPFRFFWWAIAALAALAMLWLVYKTYQITRKPFVRVFWTAFSGLFTAVSILVAVAVTDRGPIPWVGYTPQRLAEAVAKQKVIVLDFTAEWCLTCKALEAGVLHRPEVVALLKRPDVVPLRVDLTGRNDAGKAKLKELGWVGIPLLVIQGPSAPEPVKYDAYTPEMVIAALAKAGGWSQATASAGPVHPPAR